MESNTVINIHIPDIYFDSEVHISIERCDGVKDCLNTDLDERFCDDEQENICDLTCQVDGSCLDENVCNGLTYGMFCEAEEDCLWREGDECLLYHYHMPARICDGIENFSDGKDEKNCTVDEKIPSCFNLYRNVTSRLHNFTRCGPRVRKWSELSLQTSSIIPFCEDFMDQTNCTDNTRVGLECLVRGYNTTVAKQVICPDKDIGFHEVPQICDDGLEKVCLTIGPSCTVHKHQLCDNVTDCGDNSDEHQEQCLEMTNRQCLRKFRSQNRTEMPFPLVWAKDGVLDCLDGTDESEDWPTCGAGRTFRAMLHTVGEVECYEVFLCLDQDKLAVSFSNLCGRRKSCGTEIRVCSVSRMQHRTFSTAIKDYQDKKVMMMHCLRGLPDMSNVRRDMKCSAVHFHFPLRIGTFGWNKTVELNLPANKQDCKHFYGEYYVFLSCLGLCEEAVCPITRPIMWNSCPGQFNGRKIFTVDRKGHLTFLMKDQDLKRAGSDLYLCENTNCVSYDEVCNLEDDCGDFSDEWMCVNHFKCNASGEYLPIVQKCDGTIHCSDKSDECNESCGREVVSSSFLKVVGWIIGAAAVLLNFVSLFTGVSSLKTCDTEPALLNKALVMLVGIGDLLIGVYLVVISISDAHHSDNFCNLQLNWLSSDTCVALGIRTEFRTHTEFRPKRNSDLSLKN